MTDLETLKAMLTKARVEFEERRGETVEQCPLILVIIADSSHQNLGESTTNEGYGGFFTELSSHNGYMNRLCIQFVFQVKKEEFCARSNVATHNDYFGLVSLNKLF